MFIHTREALNQVVRDFKFASRTCTFGTQIFYIGYLIYAICAGVGYLWANIALLAICGIYFIFTALTLELKSKELKLIKRNTRHTFRWVKILIRAVVLVSMVYSIYISATAPTPITIILTVISVIGWLLSLSLELITIYVENRVKMLINGLKEDFHFEEISNAAGKVGSVVGSVSSAVKSFLNR